MLNRVRRARRNSSQQLWLVPSLSQVSNCWSLRKKYNSSLNFTQTKTFPTVVQSRKCGLGERSCVVCKLNEGIPSNIQLKPCKKPPTRFNEYHCRKICNHSQVSPHHIPTTFLLTRTSLTKKKKTVVIYSTIPDDMARSL